jgi:hypothetical protein
LKKSEIDNLSMDGCQGEKSKEEKEQYSMLKDLKNLVLDNIRVEIKNVHFRIEDR